MLYYACRVTLSSFIHLFIYLFIYLLFYSFIHSLIPSFFTFVPDFECPYKENRTVQKYSTARKQLSDSELSSLL